jgi:hypothetical protein
VGGVADARHQDIQIRCDSNIKCSVFVCYDLSKAKTEGCKSELVMERMKISHRYEII